MVKHITSQAEFDGALKAAGDKLVVVDFTASWCGPCKMIAPVFEKMADEFTDVVFLKVDVDEASELSQRCEIRCMPTFQFYKNGKKVDELQGADKAALREKVVKNRT